MMRFSFLLTIATASLFSIEISMTKNVSTMVEPDVLSTYINFTQKSKDESIIKTNLNNIIKEVKNFDKDSRYCRGGGYNLYPEYSYKDNTRDFIGYVGNLSFDCEFNSIDYYNDLVAILDNKTSKDVQKTLGAINLKVSSKKQSDVTSKLQLELINVAVNQARVFSKELSKKCNLKKIDFTDSYSVNPRGVIYKAAMSDSVATESPLVRDQELSLNALIALDCN